MTIDWFTFAAQVFNFLILVALLRWLLYGPIVRAMKEREEKIAARLEEADQQREQADERARDYEQKSREIHQQSDELLKEAREAAQEERQRLLKEAKGEIQRRREQWREALRREQDDLLADLRRQAGEMALHAARKTLEQLANAELEPRMGEAFVSRLEQLDDEQREEIQRHMEGGDRQIVIRSAFDISDEQRQRFNETICKSFEVDAEISFERSTELICGLELDTGDYNFGWNVKNFLHDLDVEFSERLGENQ